MQEPESDQVRLERLRAQLARVRQTIERAEDNGQAFNIGGSQVTQVAYERATERERMLEGQIRSLEAKLGLRRQGRVGQFHSRGEGRR